MTVHARLLIIGVTRGCTIHGQFLAIVHVLCDTLWRRQCCVILDWHSYLQSVQGLQVGLDACT